MTTLFLDIAQRVNLVAMFDGLECSGRREVFAVCRLQEQLQLSDDEKAAINWQKITGQDGREYATWTLNAASKQPKKYELAGDDLERVCRAVDSFRMVPGRDRVWYEPLVKQLPQLEPQALAVNGAGKP